jgi:hypothetical protein
MIHLMHNILCVTSLHIQGMAIFTFQGSICVKGLLTLYKYFNNIVVVTLLGRGNFLYPEKTYKLPQVIDKYYQYCIEYTSPYQTIVSGGLWHKILIIFVIIITFNSLAVLEKYLTSVCSIKCVLSMYMPIKLKTQKVSYG